MPSPIEQNFRNSWESLLNFALRRGVPYQDAEDLVSATLHIALDQFVEERGKFLTFCTTVLSNKIKNYWRDRKPNDPIDELDLPDPGLAGDFEKDEERARMKEMIDRIREHLTAEETEFINALGAAFENLESRAVSEAARLLGLDPAKGWDVFRRIQRKAKSLFPLLETREMPAAEAPPAPVAEPTLARAEAVFFKKSPRVLRETPSPLRWPPSLAHLARFAIREASYWRAMDAFTTEQKNRLRSIFS
jgi:DNA-directed RNA polymerase specialized sigma24 family protein